MFRRATPAALLLSCLGTLAGSASAELRMVDFLPGTFHDIRSTGTNLVPFNDGEFDIVTTVGNPRFPAGVARISVNGGVRFGIALPGNGDLAPTNAPLPSALAFNGNRALLPFWDDFIATNGAFVFGSIQHQELNGTYIIQWTNVKLQSAATQDRITFQLQIPSSGDVLARFVYADILGAANGGAGATIGYQGTSPTDMAQHSFDASRAVTDGTVLSLIDFVGQAFLEGVEGQFIDIAGTGTPLGLASDGHAVVNTQVRNAIVVSSPLLVSSNGGIRLSGTSTSLTGTNSALPSFNAYALGRALLPFWDDIDTRDGTVGEVYVQELADRLIVQWDDVGFQGQPTTERATFQVQILHESGLVAQFLYVDVEGARAQRGGSATVGYQPDNLFGVAQHSLNAPVLRDGLVLSFVASFEVGATYCTPAANSTGGPGRISAKGSTSVAVNNLFLRATDLPDHATAFFIVSDTTAFVPGAGGSQGNLCLGGAIGRAVGGIKNSGGTGIVNAVADLTVLPTAAGTTAVLPGDTLNFQCWHRDAVAGVVTSNFTDALQVRFAP